VTLQVVLKREGYAIIEAADATEALEQIRHGVPDLIITEMRLPRVAGGELIRTIRSDRSYPRVRVLAIGDKVSRSEAEAAGADIFQPNPVTPEQMVRLVTSMIGRA
jgi:CheY-like chemotaxis protein